MSNPYTGVVAAALRKAQLLLGGAGELPPLHREACLEGAVLALWRGYLAFLAEIASQLQLSVEPDSPAALARAAESRGKYSTEARELADLLADDASWLSGLQGAWQGLWRFAAEKDRPAPASAQLIPARELVAAPQELTTERVAGWRASLEELVRRQRAQLQEW